MPAGRAVGAISLVTTLNECNGDFSPTEQSDERKSTFEVARPEHFHGVSLPLRDHDTFEKPMRLFSRTITDSAVLASANPVFLEVGPRF